MNPKALIQKLKSVDISILKIIKERNSEIFMEHLENVLNAFSANNKKNIT